MAILKIVDVEQLRDLGQELLKISQMLYGVDPALAWAYLDCAQRFGEQISKMLEQPAPDMPEGLQQFRDGVDALLKMISDVESSGEG